MLGQMASNLGVLQRVSCSVRNTKHFHIGHTLTRPHFRVRFSLSSGVVKTKSKKAVEGTMGPETRLSTVAVNLSWQEKTLSKSRHKDMQTVSSRDMLLNSQVSTEKG